MRFIWRLLWCTIYCEGASTERLSCTCINRPVYYSELMFYHTLERGVSCCSSKKAQECSSVWQQAWERYTPRAPGRWGLTSDTSPAGSTAPLDCEQCCSGDRSTSVSLHWLVPQLSCLRGPYSRASWSCLCSCSSLLSYWLLWCCLQRR